MMTARGRRGKPDERGRSETGLSQCIDVTLEAFCRPGRICRRREKHRSDQSRSNPEPEDSPMSKLMVLFVLFMSGALYDPPRVLHQLGPEATAVGWKIASTFRLR